MSIRSMFEAVVGELELKKRWRQLKARKQQLPENHRKAHDAVERYLMYSAGIADGGGNAVDPDNRINPDNSDNSDKES